MKAVFSQKPGSIYDDVKGQRYHFPLQYLKRVEATIGDWIIYYEEIEGRKGRFYTGLARVNKVEADNETENNFYAYLEEFLDFDRLVEYRENSGYEKNLVREDGSINGGHAQNAVRHITNAEFSSIVNAGLSESDELPPRTDAADDEVEQDQVLNVGGLSDVGQADFLVGENSRPIVASISNRKWRDRKFKQHIRRAYDLTCAFTGLRLINGGGRPEVEAAHIVPVAEGGNDSVRNGIALSGTVHWMFDRGLLSLQDDFSIMRSRHLNYDISHIIHEDLRARVPKELSLQPHPKFLKWHRENRFKT